MRLQRSLSDLREELLLNLDASQNAYYRAEVFGGPSLYFHEQSLLAAKCGECDPFAEKVYAVLASWGMHRMGRGGSKMLDFDSFRNSLRALWPTILELQKVPPNEIGKNDWRRLEKIFRELRCMASATSLVGNSKVMAHALPNLIPPVDREYTLRFLFGRTDIVNGIDIEWLKLEKILKEFFYPMSLAESFLLKSDEWTKNSTHFKWDTSPLKIVDNLIIGFIKINRSVDSNDHSKGSGVGSGV